jgi:hypothetical protein
MLNQLDNYFLSLPEPEQGCLLFVRQFILGFNSDISEHWHYNTPFYYYKEKWMCYISYQKKQRTIYLGFVHGYKLKHKKLLSEGRKQIKVYYLDPAKDLDIKTLRAIFKEALHYVDSLTLKR